VCVDDILLGSPHSEKKQAGMHHSGSRSKPPSYLAAGVRGRPLAIPLPQTQKEPFTPTPQRPNSLNTEETDKICWATAPISEPVSAVFTEGETGRLRLSAARAVGPEYAPPRGPRNHRGSAWSESAGEWGRTGTTRSRASPAPPPPGDKAR
jgi:hypothetical protein